MESKGKIVIIGATSSIAEHCARIWVKKSPEEIVLVGRNYEKTKRVAQDLKVRNPKITLSVYSLDFNDLSQVSNLVEEVYAAGNVSLVLIAHGNLVQQVASDDKLKIAQESLLLNAISPVMFAEAFSTRMNVVNFGTLVIIGSVAGDRGRKSNYIYGSAKSLLATYVQGLQHRFAGTMVRIVLIKPGPTDSPMTFHMRGGNTKLASVEAVALDITRGIELGKSVVYTPKKWRYIMFIIKLIPSYVFNRLNI